MTASSAKPRPDGETSVAGQPDDRTHAAIAAFAADARPFALVRSALAFAAVRHAGQRRDSDGAAFIEHPVAVARLLHDAGCSQAVVAAGLLHDTVEDTDATVAEIGRRFGAEVAALVQAVTEDPAIPAYRRRKQLLREQVRDAGTGAALVFAADKISKVRELPDRLERDRARIDAPAICGHPLDRIERSRGLRLEHYRESLQMLEDVAPRHPLVDRLARELAAYPRS